MTRFRARSWFGWVGVAALAGCASPPNPADFTPRFEVGKERIEAAQVFVELDTPVKDIGAHLGVRWRARVRNVGPTGAEIEAQILSAVLELPGGFSVDTESILPLGLLTAEPVSDLLGNAPLIGPLLYELIDKRFAYTVAPNGEVTLQNWDQLVQTAARDASVDTPPDGWIPDATVFAAAIGRAYGAMPHEQVALDGSASRPLDFAIERANGPRVQGSDTLIYRGFGEVESTFGGEEITVEGLELELSGRIDIEARRTRWGPLREGGDTRQGQVITSDDANELVLYREQVYSPLHPETGIGWLDEIEVARWSEGWLFFAETRWD